MPQRLRSMRLCLRARHVERLARVLLEVRAADADASSACRRRRRSRPPPSKQSGHVVLADLVALREVGIEVVLPVPLRARGDRAAEREPAADAEAQRLAVEHRQRAREPETDRAHVRVGLRAVDRRAGAEALRLRALSWRWTSMPTIRRPPEGERVAPTPADGRSGRRARSWRLRGERRRDVAAVSRRLDRRRDTQHAVVAPSAAPDLEPDRQPVVGPSDRDARPPACPRGWPTP